MNAGELLLAWGFGIIGIIYAIAMLREARRTSTRYEHLGSHDEGEITMGFIDKLRGSKQPTPVTVVIPGDGRFDITAAGTEYHVPALQKVLQGEDSVRTRVELVPEPTNKYDKAAIRVDIDKEPVGYLSRSRGPGFAKAVLRHLAEDGVTVDTWTALVEAVVERRDHPSVPIWVQLDIPKSWLK